MGAVPSQWMRPESRSRRLVLGLCIYIVCAVAFAAVAGPARLSSHTQFNHYAHLANAWLHGRQDLAGGPPGYAQGNDFAQYDGKTYISFPPFPAVLMLPFVALAGSPENFRDGQFICWLAGVGPAVLFLVLEKLRRTERSRRSETENAILALLLAFGTVYFFTAVEGTVWFAAHVVGVAVLSLYLLCALDAEHPLLAGLMLGCAYATRPTTALTAALFALEAIRVSTTGSGGLPRKGSLLDRVEAVWGRIDRGALLRSWGMFAAPIIAILGAMAWMNYLRFHRFDPTVGHEFLTVGWASRIQKWGLFGYHYLGKNLGVMLTELPWLPPKGTSIVWWLSQTADPRVRGGQPPFQINEHGLALWFTTPIYLWLLRPRRRGWLHDVTVLATLGTLAINLLYQNSGWRTFGYRFSNDYAPLLFILLAVGDRPMKRLFACAAAWGIVWNLFGAITFDRGTPTFDRFYFRDGSQAIVYQPD
jgi:hypothetical protein